MFQRLFLGSSKSLGLRIGLGLTTTTFCYNNYYTTCEPSKDTYHEELRRALEPYRKDEQEMRDRWEKDEDGWRKFPLRAWPVYQPDIDQIQQIRDDITLHQCPLQSALEQKQGTDKLSQICSQKIFEFATALVFNGLDGQAGLDMYLTLARNGHVDGMVASGVLLTDGFGVEQDEAQGVEWLQKAVEHGSVQGSLELGALLYRGLPDINLDMDEEKAVEYFEVAAKDNHMGGQFLLADCLLEGCGCEIDVARGIPLMYASAEQGHRYARQLIRQYLDQTAT